MCLEKLLEDLKHLEKKFQQIKLKQGLPQEYNNIYVKLGKIRRYYDEKGVDKRK